ncbi:hypothetical protein G7054_g1268 [Neopestalotiopsis clavispora]|nr:hypothetical protein G7054_g1268 [Neopestalotiopsis clavispora]
MATPGNADAGDYGSPSTSTQAATFNWTQQLQDAILNHRRDVLQKLLESGAPTQEVTLKHRFEENDSMVELDVTPLTLAVALGCDSMTEILLNYNSDANTWLPVIGGTVLHMAARFGNRAITTQLLWKGAALNQTDNGGNTPLHLASRYGQQEIVSCLLENGADFTLSNNYRLSPFQIAAMYGKAEILKILCGRGAGWQINMATQGANAPLHLASLYGHVETAEWMLNNGAAIDQTGTDGATPLALACSYGAINSAIFLLQRGANVHKRDIYMDSPILIACFHGRLEFFQLLRRHGGPWHREPDKDRHEILKLLFGEGMDIDQPNLFGHSPLFAACQEQKLQHIEHLLDLGASIDLRLPRGGITALMEASCKANSHIVLKLLERGANTETKNLHGLTSLMLASRAGWLENVKLLIKFGAKVSTHDKEGYTPLGTALYHQHINIAFEILMTEYHLKNSNPPNLPKKQPYQAPEIAKRLLEGIQKTELLTMDQQQSVMYWAVSHGAVELAQYCVSYNKDVLRWSHDGNGWLHVASEGGTEEIARLLLELAPLQPNERKEWSNFKAIIDENHRGDSPLSLSIRLGHTEVENLFWGEFERYKDVDKLFMQDHSADTDAILEALARYERPGHEDILQKFLKHLAEHKAQTPKDYGTLYWAVKCSRAAVVWWLLSKGGYSSGRAIEEAVELVAPRSHGIFPQTKDQEIIRELLYHPPPHLDHIDNPNKEHVSKFPAEALQAAHPTSEYIGTVLDVVSHGGMIKVPWITASIQDIIYKKGPDALMQEARDESKSLTRESMRQLGLVELKRTLQHAVCGRHGVNQTSILNGPKAQVHPLEHSTDLDSSQLDLRASKTRSNINHNALQLRWVHLPVNEHVSAAFNARPLKLKKTTKISAAQLYICHIWPPVPITMILSNPEYATELESKKTTLRTHQFYYSTITDFSRRDNDQVLSKFLDPLLATHSASDDKKTETPTDCIDPPQAAKTNRIFMVNQLWVWLIDDKTIITAAASIDDVATSRVNGHRSSTSIERDFPGSLLSNVVRNILYGESGSQFERATSAQSVLALILNVATGFFNEKSIDSSGPSSTKAMKSPTDIFRESIRRVADAEAELFLEFQENLRHRSKSTTKRDSDNRYHVISKETELLAAIRDIRDELQILRSLAQDQEVVWKQAFSNDARQYSGLSASCTPSDVKADLDEMLSETDKIDDYIKSLLDLRQAEFGRLQADDSARQANAIFIFTLMTIIFLPLSFLASLFALPVSIFPHDPAGDVQYEGSWLFPIIWTRRPHRVTKSKYGGL